jgi:hypothetical protein
VIRGRKVKGLYCSADLSTIVVEDRCGQLYAGDEPPCYDINRNSWALGYLKDSLTAEDVKNLGSKAFFIFWKNLFNHRGHKEKVGLRIAKPNFPL